MEEARKKLRLCLALVVAVAVIVGLAYYFGDVKRGRNMSEGTLVRQEGSAGAIEENTLAKYAGHGGAVVCAADIGGSYGVRQ